MQYMMLINSVEGLGSKPGTETLSGYIQAYQEFSKMCVDKGVMHAGNALQPVSAATTATRENGTVDITDRPYSETRE